MSSEVSRRLEEIKRKRREKETEARLVAAYEKIGALQFIESIACEELMEPGELLKVVNRYDYEPTTKIHEYASEAEIDQWLCRFLTGITSVVDVNFYLWPQRYYAWHQFEMAGNTPAPLVELWNALDRPDFLLLCADKEQVYSVTDEEYGFYGVATSVAAIAAFVPPPSHNECTSID